MDRITLLPTSSLSPHAELCGLLLTLLIWEASTERTLYGVFLNSYSHCGHDKTFLVTPEQGFVVMSDFSPNTGTKVFRDCETNFYSKKDAGRICVVQEGKINEINDQNAELLVHDGYETDDAPMIFSLRHEGRWAQREYCTKSPYINFYLRKIVKSERVDIRKVYINLRVLDIESRDRRLYLDEIYCDQSYELLNSQVSIYNRAFQSSDLPARNLTHNCSLKMEKEKNDNKSICFVYVPSARVACSSDWIITVQSESRNLGYKLQCNDTRAKQLHAWCSNNRTHSLTLNFQRADNFLFHSSLEAPEMFRYIFADYEGSPESLLEKVKRELSISAEGSGLEIGWIICIVLAFVALLAAGALIYWKRHLLPCVQYKAVHNPGSAASV